MAPRVLLFSLDEWKFSDRLALILEPLGVDKAALERVHYAHDPRGPEDPLSELPERGARPALEAPLLAMGELMAELARQALGLTPKKEGAHSVTHGISTGFHWSATREQLASRFRAAGFEVVALKAVKGVPRFDWLEQLTSQTDSALQAALNSLPGAFPKIDRSSAGLAALLLAQASGGTRARISWRLAGLQGLDLFDLADFFEQVDGPVLSVVRELQAREIEQSKAKPAPLVRKAARRPPKAPARSIGKQGVSITVQAEDPAYLSLADVNSYRPSLKGWSFDTLTRKITTDMNAGRLVAFGTPEDRLRIRLTTGPFRGHSNAVASSWLEVTGALALATYTSITMAADGSDFPDATDARFHLPVGRYRVDVHRLFAHEAGAQFAEGKLRKDYVIAFSPLRLKPPKLAWVPWAIPE